MSLTLGVFKVRHGIPEAEAPARNWGCPWAGECLTHAARKKAQRFTCAGCGLCQVPFSPWRDHAEAIGLLMLAAAIVDPAALERFQSERKGEGGFPKSSDEPVFRLSLSRRKGWRNNGE